MLMCSSSLYTLATLEMLVGEFEAQTLPREQWIHEAHLAVAFWYLWKYSLEEATDRICSGIPAYNHACGIVTTATSGYHETITRFYIRAIYRFIERQPAHLPVGELLQTLLATFGDRSLPLQYYSPARLFSWEARKGWVEPDLKPLDDLEG